jgi:predicted dehydrogenase
MINIGVIGCGYWGPNLIRNFNELKDSRVRWVADLSKTRLKLIKEKYNFLKTAQDYRDVLKDPQVDAVVVVTHVSTHFPIARDVLKSGRHVFIEKPMTDSAFHAEELVKLSAKKKRIIMVGHTFEYNPAVARIGEMIRSKAIGDVYYIDSSRVNLGLHQPDVSVLWDLGPHDISIILSWLGKVPQRVSAIGKSYVQSGIEDVVFLVMEFDRRLIAHIHISWLAPSKLRRTVIIGNKRMVVYDDMEPIEKIKIFDRGVSILSGDEYRKILPDYRVGDIISPNIELAEPLNLECRHFLDCIEYNKKPRTDGNSGLRVVKVLEAAERSLKNKGKPIAVDKG